MFQNCKLAFPSLYLVGNTVFGSFSWKSSFWLTFVLSLASNLSLQEGRLSCRSESPDKLAFEANDEVDPEVTAAAAAAIEAEVDTAVTDDDTDPVKKYKQN